MRFILFILIVTSSFSLAWSPVEEYFWAAETWLGDAISSQFVDENPGVLEEMKNHLLYGAPEPRLPILFFESCMASSPFANDWIAGFRSVVGRGNFLEGCMDYSGWLLEPPTKHIAALAAHYNDWKLIGTWETVVEGGRVQAVAARFDHKNGIDILDIVVFPQAQLVFAALYNGNYSDSVECGCGRTTVVARLHPAPSIDTGDS